MARRSARGLATGVERLSSSQSKSKVIILLTDGEDNGGRLDPNTAKEIAKSFGVRVYTVGMGTEGFAPVPVQTASGVIMQREKVSIDEKLLTQIANETGGKYFRAKDNESLSGIYKEIDQMEKSKFEVNNLHALYRKIFSLRDCSAGFRFAGMDIAAHPVQKISLICAPVFINPPAAGIP